MQHVDILILYNMKIISITATFKREKITIDTLELLAQQKGMIASIVVGSCEEDKHAAESVGAVYVHHDNHPLGSKWQAGVDKARELDPDAILICGSDDWLTSNWCEVCSKEIEKGFDLVGKSECFMCNAFPGKSLGLIQFSYKNKEKGPIGAGRMISRRILDKLDWKLFPLHVTNSLDHLCNHQIVKHANGKVKILNGSNNHILCVKSTWNAIDSWEDIIKNKSGETTINHIDSPESWIGSHFPSRDVNMYKKIFPYKIMICAANDWANLGYETTQCLRSCGVKVDMYIRNPHAFKYEKQGNLVNSPTKMCNLMYNYDIIEFVHAGVNVLFDSKNKLKSGMEKTLNDLKKLGKKLVFVSNGTAYRQHNEVLTPIVNKYMDASIVETADLLGFAMKEYWSVSPVNTDIIKPTRWKQRKQLVIAHYPSNFAVKDTDLIKRVVNSISGNFKFLTNSKVAQHPQNLKRMSECDIYIDHQGYKQNGRDYGEWSRTTLEAAALGKIVITCSRARKLYETTYGKLGPLISNSPAELRFLISQLIHKSPQELSLLKVAMRKWAVDNHSYKPTAQRLIKIYQTIMGV